MPLLVLTLLGLIVVMIVVWARVERMIQIGRTLMANDTQIVAFLDQLDAYTSQMATAQTLQNQKTIEIAADIDRLLAGGTLDPATVARLQVVSDGLAASVAFEQAQAQTLTQIAAKSDEPLPPAVPVAPITPA